MSLCDYSSPQTTHQPITYHQQFNSRLDLLSMFRLDCKEHLQEASGNLFVGGIMEIKPQHRYYVINSCGPKGNDDLREIMVQWVEGRHRFVELSLVLLWLKIPCDKFHLRSLLNAIKDVFMIAKYPRSSRVLWQTWYKYVEEQQAPFTHSTWNLNEPIKERAILRLTLLHSIHRLPDNKSGRDFYRFFSSCPLPSDGDTQ